MSTLSGRLALAAGLSPAEADLLQHAAVLHDVGKVGIPDALLLKPGPLDPAERTVMETHTTAGPSSSRARDRRWSSSPSRSPGGTTSAGTAPGTRTASAATRSRSPPASAPSATSSTRCSPRARTRRPWTLEQTLAELRTQRGRHFDPELVDQFLALVGELEPALLAPGGTAPEVGVLDLTEPVAAAVSPVV